MVVPARPRPLANLWVASVVLFFFISHFFLLPFLFFSFGSLSISLRFLLFLLFFFAFLSHSLAVSATCSPGSSVERCTRRWTSWRHGVTSPGGEIKRVFFKVDAPNGPFVAAVHTRPSQCLATLMRRKIASEATPMRQKRRRYRVSLLPSFPLADDEGQCPHAQRPYRP